MQNVPASKRVRKRREVVPQSMAEKKNRTSDTNIFSRFYSLPPERGIDIALLQLLRSFIRQAHPRSTACFTSRLLGSALHALAAGLLVVLVHAAGTLGARALHGVYALELEVLGHGVGRRDGLGLAGREDGLESLDLLRGHGSGLAVLVGRALDGCGELDVELDVKVAVVVVAV